MAIVKTIFVNTTLSGQKTELLEYLQANASDYFDEIAADASGNISCKVGNTIALLIGMDGTTKRRVILSSGNYIETAGTGAITAPFKYGKKTANGLLLRTDVIELNGTNVGAMYIFICKNENGDTCIFGDFKTGMSSGGSTTYFTADIKNDSTILKLIDGDSTSARSSLSKSATVTALTPLIFSNGHYAPKAFFGTFNQYALTECDLNINGKSYVSDGVSLLAD